MAELAQSKPQGVPVGICCLNVGHYTVVCLSSPGEISIAKASLDGGNREISIHEITDVTSGTKHEHCHGLRYGPMKIYLTGNLLQL